MSLLSFLRRLFGRRPTHVPPATFGLAAAITVTTTSTTRKS